MVRAHDDLIELFCDRISYIRLYGANFPGFLVTRSLGNIFSRWLRENGPSRPGDTGLDYTAAQTDDAAGAGSPSLDE